MQSACQAIARAFNERKPPRPVQFVDCYIIQRQDGTWWGVEPSVGVEGVPVPPWETGMPQMLSGRKLSGFFLAPVDGFRGELVCNLACLFLFNISSGIIPHDFRSFCIMCAVSFSVLILVTSHLFLGGPPWNSEEHVSAWSPLFPLSLYFERILNYSLDFYRSEKCFLGRRTNLLCHFSVACTHASCPLSFLKVPNPVPHTASDVHPREVREAQQQLGLRREGLPQHPPGIRPPHSPK